MTLKMDDTRQQQQQTTLASPKCQAVSSDDDAGHERDMGINTLLSAAATIDPIEPIGTSAAEESAAQQQETSSRDPSAALRAVATRESKCDVITPNSSKCTSEKSEKQSIHRSLKRKAETSSSSDSDNLPKIARIQPSQEEILSATTHRRRHALLTWYDRLSDLLNFKAKYGHAGVPQQFPGNRALGIWVNKQRMQKRKRDNGQKSSLTDHRVKLLDEAGFQWAKHKGDVSWDQHYQELNEFYLQNGHCNVPTKYPENKSLGRWVSTQRSQMKKWKRGSYSLMTNERYEKLCKLGFHFELLPSKKKDADDDSDKSMHSILEN